MAQDQDKEKLQADTDQEKVNPKVDSGQGQERRDDEEFPKQRNAGEFGTHGGPKKNDQRDLRAPGSSKAGSQ